MQSICSRTSRPGTASFGLTRSSSKSGHARRTSTSPAQHTPRTCSWLIYGHRRRRRLLLTYKFGALLFTQILRVPHLRVKASKKEILLCQCDKNSYSYALLHLLLSPLHVADMGELSSSMSSFSSPIRHIRSTAEFLPKLQSFIAEFVSNKNFVGTSHF